MVLQEPVPVGFPQDLIEITIREGGESPSRVDELIQITFLARESISDLTGCQITPSMATLGLEEVL